MLKSDWCESYQNIHAFDKIRKCHYINVRDLYDAVPYPDVSDAMITYYLHSKSFIDTMDGKHNGSLDAPEIHAQRIASLIHSCQKGMLIHPITICYCDQTKEIEIDDGWHRMRAFYFLNERIAYRLAST